MAKRLALVLFLAFVLTGCYTTRISSARDESIPARRYVRILVDGPWEVVESELAGLLSVEQTESIPLSSVKTPDWKGSDSDLATLCEKYKFEAVLSVKFKDSTINVNHVPATSETQLYFGSQRPLGQLAYGGNRVGTTGGGLGMYQYTVFKPAHTEVHTYSNYYAELLDCDSKIVVWRADITQSEGEASALTEESRGKAVARKCVRQLVKDGLLAEK